MTGTTATSYDVCAALEDPLECGLLLRGGAVPRLLAEHLTSAHGLAA